MISTRPTNRPFDGTSATPKELFVSRIKALAAFASPVYLFFEKFDVIAPTKHFRRLTSSR